VLNAFGCGSGTDTIDADAHDVPTDCEIERVNGEPVQYGVSVALRPALLVPVAPITIDRHGRGTIALKCGKQRPSHCRARLTLTKQGRRVARVPIDLLPRAEHRVRFRARRSVLRRLQRQHRGGTQVTLALSAAATSVRGSMPLRYPHR
jgi:hypothetical protein